MTRESITLIAGKGLLCLTLTVLASVNFGDLGSYGVTLPFNLLVVAGSSVAFTTLISYHLVCGGQLCVGPSARLLTLLILATLFVCAAQSIAGIEFYIGLRISSLLFMTVALLGWSALAARPGAPNHFWRCDPVSMVVAMALISTATGVLPFVFVPVIYGEPLTVSLPYVFGVFQQPNVMGSMAVIGLAALMAVSGSSASSLSEHWRMLAALFFGLAIVYLQSRTTYISALLVLGLHLLDQRRVVAQQASSLRQITLLVLGIWLGVLALTQVEGMRRGAELVTDRSGSKRVEIWAISRDMFEAHPLLGNGIGNFTKTFSLAQAERFNTDGTYSLHNVSHPHNELLLWLVEGGFLYGLLLVGGVLWILTRWHKARPLSLAEWALLVAVGLHSFTEYPLHFSVPHMLALAMALIFIEHSRSLILPTTLNHPKPLAYVILCGGGVAAAFFLNSLVGLWQINKAMVSSVDLRERIQKFQSVHFPYLYRDLIELNVQVSFLAYAYQSRQPELAVNYINWAEQISSEEMYRWTRIYHLAVAKLMVGDQEGAKKALAFLEYLYPPSIVPPQEIVVPINGYPQPIENAEELQ